MNDLYLSNKNPGFIMLRVAIKEDKDPLSSYCKELKLDFPVFMDSEGKIARDYGVRSHPTGFFIDPEGRVVGRLFGGRDWAGASAKNFINYLLNSSTPNGGKK